MPILKAYKTNCDFCQKKPTLPIKAEFEQKHWRKRDKPILET